MVPPAKGSRRAPSLRQYTGVVHVHSERSGGGSTGTLAEAVAAAKACGLDFIVFTDHGSRGFGQDNLEGWHDGVLVLCGEEVSTPEGHFLAFETREDVGHCENLEDGLNEVRRQAGIAVGTHLQLGAGRPSKLTPPIVDPLRCDMLELWSFTDEFLSRVHPKTILHSATRPDRLITGPTRKLFNRWDVELGRRQLAVVGGVNAHQRKYPLLEWREIFPWKTSFGTIQTTVVTTELPAVAMRARDMVWQALREGRSFLTNAAIGPSEGFEFYWKDPRGRVQHMGSQAQYRAGGRIHVKLPSEAEISIRHNGQPLFWGTGEEISFPAPTPGSYRVEVRLNRRLWIMSNAIRLTLDDRPIQPTVSDFT